MRALSLLAGRIVTSPLAFSTAFVLDVALYAAASVRRRIATLMRRA